MSAYKRPNRYGFSFGPSTCWNTYGKPRESVELDFHSSIWGDRLYFCDRFFVMDNFYSLEINNIIGYNVTEEI